MRKETLSYVLLVLTAIVIGSMFAVLPAKAFMNPDTTFDTNYEMYGPHVDQLLFRMYADADSMWRGLYLGEIDLTDSPLTSMWQQVFALNRDDVSVVSTGGEAGFLTLDFNYNPNAKMGQIMPFVPPYGEGDPNGRPNPVYVGLPPISSDQNFRLGVCSLFNRTAYTQSLGNAYLQILTPVPPYMALDTSGGYVWSACPGYEYNRTLAEQYFEASRIFCDAGSGWKRYWDLDGDGVAQQAEIDACVLKFTWRQDLARKTAGEMLYSELQAMNFTFDTQYSGERSSAQNYQQCMLDKNYHMTTFGWTNIGPDPNYLYDLYHISNYWDDPQNSSMNTAALNDTVLNDLAGMILYNVTAEDARQSAIQFQQRFWAIAAQLPLCTVNQFMASRKWYSGGNCETLVGGGDPEDVYRRKPDGSKRAWLDLCNEQGLGSNSWFSLLNGYPDGYLYGNGNMTLRYGWSTQTMLTHINPLYSESYWDSILLAEIYDTLGHPDPYCGACWNGSLAESWQTGIWWDDVAKEYKSKVTITIRPDAKWQDGMPVTLADVIYSLTEAGRDLINRGYAPPTWWSTGSLIKSLSIVDAYTVEILYDVQNYLAEGWTLDFYIIPKHIWKPIIDNANPNPPNAFAPDPNLIGSGPFRYVNETYGTSILLAANKPGSEVQTDQPGSTLVTSPGGVMQDAIMVGAAVEKKLKGVKNTIKFKGLNVTDNSPRRPSGVGEHSCGEQQNFYVKDGNDRYYVQTAYLYQYTGDPPNNQLQVRQAYEVLKYDTTTMKYEAVTNPPVQYIGANFENVAWGQQEELNSYISGNKLKMSGAQAGANDYEVPGVNFGPDAYIVDDSHDKDVHASKDEDTRPESVLVGYCNGGTATFGKGTDGEVGAFVSNKMDNNGKPIWGNAKVDVIKNYQSGVKEESAGNSWKTGSFSYDGGKGSKECGIAFGSGCAKIVVVHAPGVMPPLPWSASAEYEVSVENLASLTHVEFSVNVYVDGMLQAGYPEPWTLNASSQSIESLSVVLGKGIHSFTTALQVTGPATLDNGYANPWLGHWINVTSYACVTIEEDVVGTTYYDVIGLPSYPYKTELTVPDGKVRVDDVLACATAFGSNPGDPKWNSICDINHDYKIRIDDVLAIAQMYGAG